MRMTQDFEVDDGGMTKLGRMGMGNDDRSKESTKQSQKQRIFSNQI